MPALVAETGLGQVALDVITHLIISPDIKLVPADAVNVTDVVPTFVPFLVHW
jgi:hypothetical protein